MAALENPPPPPSSTEIASSPPPSTEIASPPPPSTATRVSRETVEKAVDDLLSSRETKSESEKPQLIEEDDFLYLVLNLQEIPPKGRTNPYKIPVPHPLHAADSTELCLFMDDRPKSVLTKSDAKKKIKADNIPISKIIKLTKLRSDYRSFEAKRKLCDSYGAFFSDKRIVPLLPKLLGKGFAKKKKVPVPVDLTHKNWKEQIVRACGSAMLFLKEGTCSVLKVGRLSMAREEMVENVAAAIEGVAEVVPKKWENVKSFSMKLAQSSALPLYEAVPKLKSKIKEPRVKEGGDGEAAEKSEEASNEKVGKKKKGRIHEVQHMDSDALDDDVEKSNDGEEMGIGGKKRKKDGKVKTKKENGEDSSKKSKRAKKDESEGGDSENGDEITSGSKRKEGKVKRATKEKKDKLEVDDMEIGNEMASDSKKRKDSKLKSSENSKLLLKKAKKDGLGESGDKKAIKRSSTGKLKTKKRIVTAE